MSKRRNDAAFTAALAALADADLVALREAWRGLHHAPPPSAFKRDLLLRGIAHRMSSNAEGGFDRAVAKLLGELARATDPAAVLARQRSRRIKPGCELLREWKGTMHRVVVLTHGFAWNGEVYTSLSMVARAITGTPWNGYRFFGLARGEISLKSELSASNSTSAGSKTSERRIEI